jgi:hypothetical protein
MKPEHFLNSIRSFVCLVLATMGPSLAFAEEAEEPPVKVYLLVGQSNMQGKGSVEGEKPNTLRDMVKNDPKREFQSLVNEDGSWRDMTDVWIHYDLAPFRELRYGPLKPGYGGSGGQVGPELGFGLMMGNAEKAQVLLIKAAWGGKSLAHNFLPPSVGKYPTPALPDDPGYFYHRTLQLVTEVTENVETFFPDYKGQGFEIAGLCWHQGWNDQYGGVDAQYEENMVAFINDIRSKEHGLGVPGLPVVIATSGMIRGDSLVKTSQLAMADTAKHPQFAGNVSMVDTDKPYGPKKRQFWFDTKASPSGQGYHWNNNARSYMNIGMSMADEMRKLVEPALPARLAAYGSPVGVQLTWQLGTEPAKSIKLLRNGTEIDAKLAATHTTFVDTTALPGKTSYELIIEMQSSPVQTFRAACDTSISELTAYRGMSGVMLSWQAKGRYDAFRISRDGKVIADPIAGAHRSYLDEQAPPKGKVSYIIEPTTGTSTPATLMLNLGPADPGDALIYEPFDYPADPGEPNRLVGKSGAAGTQGEYYYLSDTAPDRAPAAIADGLSYGALPVTGNRAAGHRWSAGCAIALDDSLKKAGLLEDGATLWMSYVLKNIGEFEHRSGPGGFSLRSQDLKEGVGFKASGRQYETAVVIDGKVHGVRVTGVRGDSILVVGKITWGKDGADDTFVPYAPGFDLKQPEKYGRAAKPFNIDQTKLSLLVIQQEGNLDEIRIGPTYQSVVGRGTKQ